MKAKIEWRSFVLGAALTIAVACGLGAGAQAVGGVEYSMVQGSVFGQELSLTRAINERVEQGWELVSVAHSTEHYGFAVLKRSKR